jgi:hypothetical protein
MMIMIMNLNGHMFNELTNHNHVVDERDNNHVNKDNNDNDSHIVMIYSYLPIHILYLSIYLSIYLSRRIGVDDTSSARIRC